LNIGIIIPANHQGGISKLSTIAALDLANAGHNISIIVPLMPYHYYYVALGNRRLAWIKSSVRHIQRRFHRKPFYSQGLLSDSEHQDKVSINFVLRQASRSSLKQLDWLILHSIAGIAEYRGKYPQARQIYICHHPEEWDHGHTESFRELRTSFEGKILAVSAKTALELANYMASPRLVPDCISPIIWKQRENALTKKNSRDVILVWKTNESGRVGAEIIRLLLTIRPDTKVTIWCRLGYGYANIAKELLSMIPVVENISETELSNLYLDHHMLLFPSTHEGFGMPPIEGLACGCVPVLYRDVGAAEMYAGDGQNSIFIEGTLDSVAEKMSRVLDDEDKLQSMKSFGLESVESFSPCGYGHRILKEAGAIE